MVHRLARRGEIRREFRAIALTRPIFGESQPRGRIGGLIFRGAQQVGQVQPQRLRHASRSPSQRSSNATFGRVARSWSDLSDTQRALWRETADLVNPSFGAFGYPAGGRALFIARNRKAESVGEPPIEVDINGGFFFERSLIYNLSIEPGTSQLDLRTGDLFFNPFSFPPWRFPIWISPPIPPGGRVRRPAYRLIGYADENDLSSNPATIVKSFSLPWTFNAGDRFQAKQQFFASDGWWASEQSRTLLVEPPGTSFWGQPAFFASAATPPWISINPARVLRIVIPDFEFTESFTTTLGESPTETLGDLNTWLDGIFGVGVIRRVSALDGRSAASLLPFSNRQFGERSWWPSFFSRDP